MAVADSGRDGRRAGQQADVAALHVVCRRDVRRADGASCPTESPWLFVALFFLASLAFELSFSFYNGFLPEIADEESMNRISGYGYAAGYFGGGVALAVAIGVLMIGSGYGLTTETGLRIGLVIMGLWWAVFTLPAAFILRDRAQPRSTSAGFVATARAALGEVMLTLSRIRCLQRAGPLPAGISALQRRHPDRDEPGLGLRPRSAEDGAGRAGTGRADDPVRGHAGGDRRRLDCRPDWREPRCWAAW